MDRGKGVEKMKRREKHGSVCGKNKNDKRLEFFFFKNFYMNILKRGWGFMKNIEYFTFFAYRDKNLQSSFKLGFRHSSPTPIILELSLTPLQLYLQKLSLVHQI